MPKMRYRDLIKKDGNEGILNHRRFYENKYFGLFMNSFRFKELTEQENYYILKTFWTIGAIACFIPKATIKNDKTLENQINGSIQTITNNENGLMVFTSFAPIQYNIYDYPTLATLINKRNATFIPSEPQIVNKDIVIGYAHTTHASVRELVMYYIEKICEVENCIDTNIFCHKLPRLVIVSPEDKDRVDNIIEAIERGEHKLFLDAEDYQAIKKRFRFWR